MRQFYGFNDVYEGFYVNALSACVVMKKELEEYMDYDLGSYCKGDWNLAQKLLINGCDPLPRRRCLTRASKLYQKPYPINESLWRIPDGRNVQCRNFECLASKNPKCTGGCFEMDKEKLKWVNNTSRLLTDFLIKDVLANKLGEIRIGLVPGHIVSTTLNLGAPFNEIISLRGLIPLYLTLNLL